jgi:hypothetical protein
MSDTERPLLIVMTPQNMSEALDEFLPEPPEAFCATLKDSDELDAFSDSDELDAFSAEPDPLDAFARELNVAPSPALPVPETMPATFRLGASWHLVAAAVMTLAFLDASGDRSMISSYFSDPDGTPAVESDPDSAYLDIRSLLATIGASPAVGSTGEDAPVRFVPPPRTVEKPTPPPPEKTHVATKPAQPSSTINPRPTSSTSALPSSTTGPQPAPPEPRANASSRPVQANPPAVVPPAAPAPRLVSAIAPAVATAGFGGLSPAIPAASPSPEPSGVASSAATAPAAAAPESAVAGIATAAKPEPPSEINSIGVVLGEYRRAFGYLNSAIAAAVWPTVDRRALDRAFSQLSEQEFTFSSCEVSVQGVLASAACTGHARFVPKVGNTTPRSEPRRWDFRLRKASSGWVIDGVNAR